MIYARNLKTRVILYRFLQGQIQNTRIIAESGEGDMHDLRSLATKVKATGSTIQRHEILKLLPSTSLLKHFTFSITISKFRGWHEKEERYFPDPGRRLGADLRNIATNLSFLVLVKSACRGGIPCKILAKSILIVSCMACQTKVSKVRIYAK